MKSIPPRPIAFLGRLVLLALPIVLAGLWLGACAPTEETEVEPDETAAAPSSTPSAGPGQDYLLAHEDEISELIGKMTLEEKVGQMTQADISYIAGPADVAKYFLGSVLSGGGSDPKAGNSPEAWREMVLGYQRQAMSTRLGIPIVYGVDAVHGHSNILGAVIYPHNVGLGATRDAELVEDVYRATAESVRATGIQWSFAPCIAVARDIRWGRTYESFSEDPDLVAELGEAAVRGLHAGASIPGSDPGVIACAKHFVGDGGTSYGTGAKKDGVPDSVFEESGRGDTTGQTRWPLDRGDTRMDEAELRAVHMAGYPPAIAAGAGTIMVSYSAWNGERMSASHHLLTDVLKGDLGFQGFLVSDWAALDDIPGDYRSDIEKSINAGMDMVMVPDRYAEFYGHLVSLVKDGSVPMERIDDAVRRILRVKYAAGLMDPGWNPESDPSLLAVIGSDEHRAIGRRAVAESLVLLKNDGGALPIAKDAKRIHVVGKNADDIGNQCGGWTIQWQGQAGDVTAGGTTILQAIRDAAAPDTEVTFSADGTGGEGADVVVAVIGETPYAEMLGDRTSLALDAADRKAVAAAAAGGAPVVTVLVSGRPMVLGDTLDQSAAFVAAWLPGTEGAGVADVLFGDHPPTGKLPFSWPRDESQLPLHRPWNGEGGYDPLFPFGFGLGY